MFDIQCAFPPGNVILVTGDTPRYTVFYQSLVQLKVPRGTRLWWGSSNIVAKTTNNLLADAKAHGGWVWIIGDDHEFHPDIILRLLARRKDAVLPLCLTRHLPFTPTVWLRDGDRIYMPELNELPQKGLVEIWSGGDAGILMTEEVVAATGPPWYNLELTSTKVSAGWTDRKGEDFFLLKKIREAGYKIHVDVETEMGHTMSLTAWPRKGQRILTAGPCEMGEITYTKKGSKYVDVN